MSSFPFTKSNFCLRHTRVALVLLVSHSCRTRIVLLSHQYCTCVAVMLQLCYSCLNHVALVLPVSDSCCTFVTRVTPVSLVSDTFVAKQTRSFEFAIPESNFDTKVRKINYMCLSLNAENLTRSLNKKNRFQQIW